MLAFPLNPNTGDLFEPGGGLPIWKWDGNKWTHPTLPIPEQMLRIDTATLTATVNVPYTGQLEASGGTPPYAWEKLGGTAEWADVSSNGEVTGTPLAEGTQDLQVQVTDNVESTYTTLIEVDVLVAAGTDVMQPEEHQKQQVETPRKKARSAVTRKKSTQRKKGKRHG